MGVDLKLVSIYESNYRDVVAMLRRLADSVEAGKYGDVSEVALVLMGDKMQVFGFGPKTDHTTTHYLLCGGAAKMTKALLDHGN